MFVSSENRQNYGLCHSIIQLRATDLEGWYLTPPGLYSGKRHLWHPGGALLFSDVYHVIDWMFHRLLLSPGISAFPFLSLTKNDYNTCKFIFENNIEGSGSKTLDKDVTEGRYHGRALKVWLCWILTMNDQLRGLVCYPGA